MSNRAGGVYAGAGGISQALAGELLTGVRRRPRCIGKADCASREFVRILGAVLRFFRKRMKNGFGHFFMRLPW